MNFKFIKLSVVVLFLRIYLDLCRVATWSGNQEKSGKTKKNDKNQEKSGKNGGFFKTQEMSEKISKKHQILSVQIYKILILKSLGSVKN